MGSKKIHLRQGAVAQACNPSTLGGWGRWIMRSRNWDHPGQQGETPSVLKIQKLAGHGSPCLYSQLLGRLSQENCLNPRGRGFKILPLHSSLGNKSKTPSKKKNKKCIECSRAFRQWPGLVIHQIIHMGEKPYECNDCGEWFKQFSQWVMLQRI